MNRLTVDALRPDLVDPDIRRARTPPAELYGAPDHYRAQVERVMAQSWHWLGDASGLDAPGARRPMTLLPGCLDEPMALVRSDDGRLRGLSNVCTHRGNLIVLAEGSGSTLRCGYHGRRFGLDGRCRHMPCFEGVEGFPAESDHLAEIPTRRWGPLVFAGLTPPPFEPWFAPVAERLGHLDPDTLTAAPEGSRDYVFDAHWALYLDNYLEGFHIPFVHPGLNAALDWGAYAVELTPRGTVQVGVAAPGEPTLPLPPGHRDAGRAVFGWYLWLFPGFMMSVYPWGISLNAVQPLGPRRTRVGFRSYVWPGRRVPPEAVERLHQTELEDEAVVLQVQRGLASRLYRRGRYAPTQEVGVHHFHRLLLAALAGGGDTEGCFGA